MPAKTKKRYSKKDPLQHVLDRSDMYVGSTRLRLVDEFIAQSDDESYKVFKKEISSSPAILRIFIEALSNSIDNVERSKKTNTPCTEIRVTINANSGETTVWNNGDIVPIELDEDEGCYNHSMIFGQMLTGSNYDDEEERIISGRNGLGIKLCNIFSTFFKVRGVDPNVSKMLVQEWTGNMKNTDGPVISDSNLDGCTEVTWIPDFERFGIRRYTQDLISLYTRYVIDAAMLSKVNVYLNGNLIPVNDLISYSHLYQAPSADILEIKTKTSNVVITPSEDFQVVSFVNGVFTRLGGQHVDAWCEAIFRPIVNKFNKKGKPQLTIKDIRQFFRIFVSSIVINPEFDGQDKNKLENPSVPVAVKKTHITTICKWSVMDNIEDIIRSKEMIVLRKSERKKKSFVKIEGLDPANNAGGKYSNECTLILCEGLSAKTYAVAGIAKGVYGKSGRDWFGIYPLRGKVLNVRNSSPSVISKNAVITDLIQSIGVKHNVDYTEERNFKQLSYGKIMIMTDADSVTGDTPILIKNTDGLINVKTIDDLCDVWKGENKQYGTSDYLVWTESGWTTIKSVMRHKVTKRIFRVLTRTGIVDVTEDHSLLKENGKKITPNDCVIGQNLLHSFPVFGENSPVVPNNIEELNVKDLWKYASRCKIQYYQNMTKNELLDKIKMVCENYENLTSGSGGDGDITTNEAYAMGLFFTGGTCGIYKWKYTEKLLCRVSYSWGISNTNLEYLEKAKNILYDTYGFDFKIIDNSCSFKKGSKHAYKLIVNGNKKIKHFVKKYRSLFYSNKCKIIPQSILNASTLTRESFYKGMYDGDGNKRSGSTRIDVYRKIGAQTVFLLCKSLGYEVSINCRRNKPNAYTLIMTKGHQQLNPYKIKKIIDLGTTEQYVYDIETSNHHFQAGIGQMIVHNTDGIHIEGLIMNFFHALFPTLFERENSFVVSMKTPIVRIFRPRQSDLLFYDERKFKQYVQTQTKNFKKKYYKGLGTTKPEDVPDTFGLKMIEYVNDENTSNNMNKVFHKRYSDYRKEWLANYDPSASFSLDDAGEITNMNMSDFIDGEMIKFSHDDCKRSIPNCLDGLKESQRKILYAVMKRKLKYSGSSLKVAQLGGYVAEHTNYHHGEQNLFETITKMANEFPGSNNIPLLYRDGMFGCVAPDTLVLLWDTSVKRADTIVIGDVLIGDDGQQRIVSDITSGYDEMYKIYQGFGDPYTVNSHHILTLKYNGHKSISWKKLSRMWVLSYFDINVMKGEQKMVQTSKLTKEEAHIKILEFANTISDCDIFDIDVQTYLELNNTDKHRMNGVKNSKNVQWDEQPVSIDPYIFGALLGDEVIRKDFGLNLNIPNEFIFNSSDVRLNMLAGFIDTDCGLIINLNGVYHIEILHELVPCVDLINSLQFIARSLGFKAEININKILIISGDVYQIPTRVNHKYIPYIKRDISPLYCKIRVERVGRGKFCGWDIDRNERFLLNDFTVTHNTRLSGGKDAASPRYIFTKMEMLTHLLYREEDFPLLECVIDDGDTVEPKFYVPILPMILINGCTAGIGTGWSCNVPCYNPLDLIACVKIWLERDGEVLLRNSENNTVISMFPDMYPWYRDFTGTIEPSGDNRYITHGVLEHDNSNKATITDLPIGMWTDKFKETCEEHVENKELKSMKNYSTPKKPNFILTESPDGFICNVDTLKLHSYLYTSNMVLFDECEQLHKFDNVDEIINKFCIVRLEYYDKRKRHMMGVLESELQFLGNKARFVQEIINEELVIMNQEESNIILELENRGYDKENVKIDAEGLEIGGYDYLLRMQVRTFTANKVRQIRNDIESIQEKIDSLRSLTIKQLWINDLTEFEREYSKWLRIMNNSKTTVKTTKKKR